ncbi:MAG TPA: flavodoxin family protein [Nitrospirota bacterium]
MKILAVLGSARRGGNTETLMREALKGAGAPDTSIHAVSEMGIAGCLGCMGCRMPDSEGCVVDDDMGGLYRLLIDADAIILGAPIYYGEVTGQMKVFMDRWYALRDSGRNLRIPTGKKVLFIVTQGAEKENTYDTVSTRLKRVLEKYGMHAEVLVASGLEGKADASERPDLLEKAFRAGKRLAFIG